MSDDILARAKMLAQAANLVAEQMVQQANEFKAQSDIRHREVEIEQIKIKKEHEIQESHKSPTKEDIGTNRSFKGAAICGSSLVTTFTDIRPFTKRGADIYIDGVTYHLADKGEWSGNRVELSADFQGPTNYEATIQVSVTEEAVNRRKQRKVVAHPVSSSEIARAVQNLNEGPLFATINSTHQSNSKKKHSSKNLNDFSSRKSSIPNYSAASAYQSEKISKNMPPDKIEVLPPSTIEEARMLDELRYEELYAQDEIRKKREDMHKRLAEKGQIKAAGRANKWLRSKAKGIGVSSGNDLVPADDDDVAPSESSYHYGTYVHESTGSGGGASSSSNHHYSEDTLEEQRKLALARALKKKREDASAALKKLEEEEAAKKKLKDMMEEKAEALRQLTQQRVAELYRNKRRQERERLEKAEAERAEKEERQAEQRADERLQRVKQLKVDTELRLKQQQEGEQLRRLQEQLDMELRLKELAEVRGRVFPMSSSLFPVSKQHQHSEVDQESGFAAYSPRGPLKPSLIVQLPGDDKAPGIGGRMARGKIKSVNIDKNKPDDDNTKERKQSQVVSQKDDMDTNNSSGKLPPIFNGSHSQKNLSIFEKPIQASSTATSSDSLRSMSAPKDPKEAITRSSQLVQSSKQKNIQKQPRNTSSAVHEGKEQFRTLSDYQKENRLVSGHQLNRNFDIYNGPDNYINNDNNSDDDFLSVDSVDKEDRKKNSTKTNFCNNNNPPTKITTGNTSKSQVEASTSSFVSSVSGGGDEYSKVMTRKKPKNPVWKLAPIPVRPFIPITTNSVY